MEKTSLSRKKNVSARNDLAMFRTWSSEFLDQFPDQKETV